MTTARQSLSTTVLLRTTFPRTIMLNLLMHWLLGSNLSLVLNILIRSLRCHYGDGNGNGNGNEKVKNSNKSKLEKQQLVRTAHSFVHFFAVTTRLRHKLNKSTTILHSLYWYRLSKWRQNVQTRAAGVWFDCKVLNFWLHFYHKIDSKFDGHFRWRFPEKRVREKEKNKLCHHFVISMDP